MNVKTAIVCLCGLAMFSACNKDKGKSDNTIRFNGITGTDILGDRIYTDPTDWRTDDSVWTDQEYALFGTRLPRYKESTDYKVMAYPNPCYHNCYLYRLNDGSAKTWEYSIVDKHYNVLRTGAWSSSNLIISADSLGITDTVRVYYRVVTRDSAAYGHGDVVIVKP